jgi:hypothetical protein
MQELLKSLAKQLPNSWQNSIRVFRSRYLRNQILQDWENKGRPVPPPHQYKQLVIEEYQKKYKTQCLVETGTYLGDMIEAQRKNFQQLYSIELSEALWRQAVDRFKAYPHIKILLGDSGKVLPDVVANLKETAIFWLDGHYSAGITVKGEKECPIYAELDAILSAPTLKHIILIDDARDFKGENDYPSIAELETYVRTRQPEYVCEVKDDLIRLTRN